MLFAFLTSMYHTRSTKQFYLKLNRVTDFYQGPVLAYNCLIHLS